MNDIIIITNGIYLLGFVSLAFNPSMPGRTLKGRTYLNKLARESSRCSSMHDLLMDTRR